jgi:hypothetical protein
VTVDLFALVIQDACVGHRAPIDRSESAPHHEVLQPVGDVRKRPSRQDVSAAARMPFEAGTFAQIAVVLPQIPPVSSEENRDVRDGLEALRDEPVAIRNEYLCHAPSADDGRTARGDRPNTDAPAVAPVGRADGTDSRRRAAKRPGLRRIAPCKPCTQQHHPQNSTVSYRRPSRRGRSQRVLENLGN